MQLGRVLGTATATSRHPTLAGWRLLLIQPLDAAGGSDGDPQLAIDPLGCRRGDDVMISSDGKAVSELVGSEHTPIRWAVIAVPDAGSVVHRKQK